jgi:ketosteroid isomerase-like protein
MKHTGFSMVLLAISLVTVMPCLSFSQKTNPKGQNSIEQEILNLEKEWFEAYQKSDADTVNRIEAEDFIVFTATGGTFTKETQILSIRNRDEARRKQMAAITRTLEQAKVRIYENVVVVNGISVAT